MCPCKHFSHEAGRQRRRRNEGLAKRSKCLSMVSVWQAVSVLVTDALHAFGEISAEPRYIALLVDLFTATLQARGGRPCSPIISVGLTARGGMPHFTVRASLPSPSPAPPRKGRGARGPPPPPAPADQKKRVQPPPPISPTSLPSSHPPTTRPNGSNIT